MRLPQEMPIDMPKSMLTMGWSTLFLDGKTAGEVPTVIDIALAGRVTLRGG